MDLSFSVCFTLIAQASLSSFSLVFILLSSPLDLAVLAFALLARQHVSTFQFLVGLSPCAFFRDLLVGGRSGVPHHVLSVCSYYSDYITVRDNAMRILVTRGVTVF
jgi:hypothetical protein